MKKTKKAFKVVLWVVAILALALIAGMITLLVIMERPAPPNIYTSASQGYQAKDRKDDFFTFLIVGLTEGLNANTIMVGAYDGVAGQINIISIPRDTRVDMQRNNRKIVAAYPVGRLGGGGHDGGIERLKYEVSTLIGFRPDFYIRIDYEAFEAIIDTIGGIELYVPFRMYYHDPCQNLHIDLQEGLQTLSGADALRFARYRTGTTGISPTISDYRRIEHQQQVVEAAINKVIHPASILRIPQFISIFNQYVYSDLTTGELVWLANQARRIGISNLNFYTLPMSGTSGAPMWYELVDEPVALDLINRTVNPLKRDITTDDVRIIR